ncbi:MAG: DNA-binding protein [Spirochaetes bacterium RBG_13_51_14]|nr:MAG: DNA-binding protein [Spirochaetes bacterium RBG_13_51_14]
MPTRYHDWFSQSKRDIEQALDSQKAGRHEWSCFAAHQAAEKAVKALHQYHNQEAWGHVVRKLLEELPASVSTPDGLLDKARVLDSYYIPTRYANGHPEGAPFEHYGKLQSEEAIKYAREIIEFCGSQMA